MSEQNKVVSSSKHPSCVCLSKAYFMYYFLLDVVNSTILKVVYFTQLLLYLYVFQSEFLLYILLCAPEQKVPKYAFRFH